MVILLVYFIVMIASTLLLTKKSETLENFMVGDRNVGTFMGALSISATWIWAPALLISAEKSYTWGLVGLFWFLVPNVLTLIIFAPFAKKIRKKMPKGTTLSEYMDKVYGRKVKNIYLLQLLLITFFSTLVQLLAGGLLVSTLTGISYPVTIILISIIAFSYSQFSGIKASMVTDAVQMLIMILVSIIIVPVALSITGGLENMVSGFGGITGLYGSLFSLKGKEVFLAFGLSTSIGLISGPFGDQSFWQRAFSIKEDKVGKAFVYGGIIFAIVPLAMASLGFMSAGMEFMPINVGMVNVELVQNFLPSIVFYPFIFIIISGLMSTIDSNLVSVTALVDDIIVDYSLADSKKSMIGLLVLAVFGALTPGITVSRLFMIYGTVRASTLFTTILTLNDVKLLPDGVKLGVLASLLLGLPVFIYGSLTNNPLFIVSGSLLSLLLSGTIALVYTKIKGEKI